MDRPAAELAVAACLREMADRLRNASATREAELTCTEMGNID